MTYMSNRTILEKADAALADLTAGGGVLQPAQAQKFMRLLIKDSVLMKQATVVPMAAPKQQISKIRFGSRILRPGQEGQSLATADRSRPDFSFVELDAKLFKGEVHLSDEVLEDSIERGELRQTIMQMLAEAISRDIEELIINGDTGSSDPFLATLDGLLRQSVSNIVDGDGQPLSKDLLTDMLKTLPSEFLRDKPGMRFLTSVDADLDFRNALAERPTAVGGSAIRRICTSASGAKYASSPPGTSPRACSRSSPPSASTPDWLRRRPSSKRLEFNCKEALWKPSSFA
jgi:HK97 family phage major capsid protein